MKTLHSFIIRPGLLSGGIIALVILLSVGGPAFAARVAGTDENVNTTTAPESQAAQLDEDTQKKETAPPVDTPEEIIQVFPAAPVDPVKQDVPAEEKTFYPRRAKMPCRRIVRK